MKTIQIYLHGENSRDPKLVEVSEEASVKDVINPLAELICQSMLHSAHRLVVYKFV